MKILIDIGHPAHVHLFKHFAHIMGKKGHKILFTCREKEFEVELLKSENFSYVSFGKHYISKAGKLWGLLKFDVQMLRVTLNYKPNLFLSHGSIYAAQIAWITRKPHIAFEDTFNKEQVLLYKLFSSLILTGDYFHPHLGKKQIEYHGYHELAYLHPRFFVPDFKIIPSLVFKDKKPLVLFRFVSWNATHDIWHTGISVKNKIKFVEEFSSLANVLISSEIKLPDQIEKYRITCPPDKIHHIIAYSSLVFSESATMASEAAVLGVPSIYLDNTGRYYTKEQEKKYDLGYNYTESLDDQQKAFLKGLELLKNNNLQKEWQEKRKKMLSDKIDVTSFLVWFVENYPESMKIMKENPNYQYRFR
ncbi:MAG: DUF354 domain-containing protein [Bacteroidales bacterium]|nr:DUF354 domain-containing protein [Bacteroidales bacterium]